MTYIATIFPVLVYSLRRYKKTGFYQLKHKPMFVPITSEITIETGMVVKEIATSRLFEVGARLPSKGEVWGDDAWEITERGPGNQRVVVALPYQELAMKYLAEVKD
jgi:hypothetical protein